jgi:NACalpha-BTF3-like transcription factor
MNLEIKVYNETAQELYIKFIQNVKDIRHVLNKIRRGRSAIEKPNITTIQIAGDKNAFRVGREDDIEAWLKRKMKA